MATPAGLGLGMWALWANMTAAPLMEMLWALCAPRARPAFRLFVPGEEWPEKDKTGAGGGRKTSLMSVDVLTFGCDGASSRGRVRGWTEGASLSSLLPSQAKVFTDSRSQPRAVLS